MSWSETRTFIRGRVASVYPDLKEWKDSFNKENIPSTSINTMYHISYESISSINQNGGYIEDDFNVIVTIFKKAYNETTDEMDAILDKALCIRQALINHREANTTNFIKGVNANTVDINPIQADNDNTIQIELEFTIRMFFNA